MLNKLANLSENMTVSHPMIDQWLSSRRQLLVAYYQLVGLTPAKEAKVGCDEVALDSFCQRLVDYLSSGHFKHYQQIETLLANESQQQLISLLYPQLEESTHKLLSLYDNYLEPALANGEIPELRQVISALGMTLEARFDLEDQLLLSTQLITPAPLTSAATTRDMARMKAVTSIQPERLDS